MRIFFGFCDTKLLHSQGRNVFTQCVFQSVRRECNFYIRHFRIILRHADVLQILHGFAAFKSVKISICERTGDFAGTVRTEVEHDDCITVIDETFAG